MFYKACGVKNAIVKAIVKNAEPYKCDICLVSMML